MKIREIRKRNQGKSRNFEGGRGMGRGQTKNMTQKYCTRWGTSQKNITKH